MATRRPPRPADLLRSLGRELEHGWPAGLTVLSGDDVYHLDRAQQALLAKLVPPGTSEFALTVFGEQKVDPPTVVSAARSVGMFAERRVVLVREVTALDGEPDALVDYAAKPPAGSYLLVRAPALDRRRKLHQALARNGRQLVFASPSAPGGLEPEAVALAAAKQLRLDRPAAALLIELCTGDLYRVDAELEKIRAWLGPEGDGRVTVDRVREVAAGSGLLSGWEVANAVLLRDREAALASVRRLGQAGQEPLRILGGLAFRARVMLEAKGMLEAGAPMRSVRSAVRAWGWANELERGLARYAMAELLAFPAALLEADRTLKSRSIAPLAVLEGLVERLILPPDSRTDASPG